MPVIPVSQLGSKTIVDALRRSDSAAVSVRGQPRFVVMGMEQYLHLRECELAAALAESRKAMAAGQFVRESPQSHLARLARAP